MQPQEGVRVVRGQQLHYRAWGPASAPPLLLLGGAGDSVASTTEALAQALAPGWQVIAYDGPAGAAAEDDAALRDFVNMMGFDRPGLVGWGDGVTPALRYAAAQPGRVALLALVL